MYEIEIKSLLGSRENAERLEARMRGLDPQFKEIANSNRQLNYYFENGGDFAALAPVIKDEKARKEFLDLANQTKKYSLRARDTDGKVLLVLKASIDDTTSQNGTARREFECEIDLPIDELGAAIEKAGFPYQAKWSRERREFQFKGANVTIDKNAGYGYLAEIEIMEEDPSKADEAKARIRELLSLLEIEELPQDRLARMFDFYNSNWRDYYGTEKTFIIN